MANVQEHGIFQLIDSGTLDPNQPANLADTGLLLGGILYDVAQHNADYAAVLRLFATDTYDFQEYVQLHGDTESEPMDEFARTEAVKFAGSYTVGYPILMSGKSTGITELMSQFITVGAIAERLSMMLKGDYKWGRRHVMSSLFQNQVFVYHDIFGNNGRGGGDINVFGPANGDATTYYSTTTQSSATDTHFLFQAAPIDDTHDPIPVMVDELQEHADNDGGVPLIFIPTDQKTAVTHLQAFVAPVVDNGIIELDPTGLQLVSSLNAQLPPDCVVLGRHESGAWIVQWLSLPPGYMIGIILGGKRPLKRRLLNAKNTGFHPVGVREDFPYFTEQWRRIEGYGTFNRVGAVIMQIGVGAYVVPANYATPLR